MGTTAIKDSVASISRTCKGTKHAAPAASAWAFHRHFIRDSALAAT